MSTRENLKKALTDLGNEVDDIIKAAKSVGTYDDFSLKYQSWYTQALSVVSTLAPDRIAEFKGYYEIDPKRKTFGSSTYVIQDYLREISVKKDYQEIHLWDIHDVLLLLITNQANILASLVTRIDGILANIQVQLLSEIQDAELTTAEKLKNTSLRAAGALAGVVLEDHLQRVADSRGVTISKRNPTIGDLNDPLKQAGIYDTTAWRKIQYLADIRNLCTHKKEREPVEEEITELIRGVNWLIKNIM